MLFSGAYLSGHAVKKAMQGIASIHAQFLSRFAEFLQRKNYRKQQRHGQHNA